VKVLITGGAGFIGSHFARMASKGDFDGITEIRVLDKFTYSGLTSNLESLHSSSKYELVIGDITNPMDVERACKGVNAVINFAAESHVDRSISDSSAFINTNIEGVRVLLEQCRQLNIRFLQVSTDEVYGSISSGSWSEDSPLEPNSPYSASKASADLLVRSFNKTYGLDTIVTRCSNNYGPNQFPEKVIPLFITNLIGGELVPIYGNGQNVRDWLHVTDHCRGIALALEKGKKGEIYNLGGGQELSNLDLTLKILDQFGFGTEKIRYVKDRMGHDMRYSVDWQKAREQLGYFPTVSFSDGLSETIRWYRDNPKWWKLLKTK
jgi:dTDP-glucose 4,6-dehydratase